MRHSLAEVCSKEKEAGVKDVVAPEAQKNLPLKILKSISDAADDAKGKEVVILDVSKNFGLADYFVIASARSDRHSQGIANKIIETVTELGLEPYSIQGLEEGQWVVVDCCEVVVHIFYEPLRHHYDLESLWLYAETVNREKLQQAETKASATQKKPHRQREAVLA